MKNLTKIWRRRNTVCEYSTIAWFPRFIQQQFYMYDLTVCIIGAPTSPSSWPAREILMKDWELSTQNSIGIVAISFFISPPLHFFLNSLPLRLLSYNLFFLFYLFFLFFFFQFIFSTYIFSNFCFFN